MKIFKTSFLIFLMLLFGFQIAKSQDLISQSELEKFLDKAEEQSQKYTQVFRNLSSEETKTKFYYKTNGDLDEKRVIKSLFIVYESPVGNYSQEYRNILEFNGKNVARDDKATEKFFAKLADADSASEESNRIFKEGTKYDGRSVSWGTTLIQNRPFAQLIRPFFDYKVIGKEKIEGRNVFVVEYQQTEQTLLIAANPTDEEKKLSKNKGGIEYNVVISDDFRPTNPLVSGKIWLDGETAQIWRNEFKITLHPAKLADSIVSVEISNEYQKSDFGILVPENFFVRSYKIKGKSEKDLRITKDVESIYEYSTFREFKTDTKDYKIEK